MITGSERYQEITLSDLQSIFANAAGRAILNWFARTTHQITIEPPAEHSEPFVFANAWTRPVDHDAARNHFQIMGSHGTDSIITYNPTYTMPYRGDAPDSGAVYVAREPWMILTHEIVHAMHNAYGENQVDWSANDSVEFDNREEELTVGSIREELDLTENSVYANLAMALRSGHRRTDRTTLTYMNAQDQWYRVEPNQPLPGTPIAPLNDRVSG